MIIVLQAAAVVAVLIGLVTIGYGIPVKEFSFGNTLILVGTISLCTGVILLALSVVALELRMVARRLASGRPAQEPRARTALPPFPAAAGAGEGPAFSRDQAPNAGQIEPSMASPVMPPPWHEDPRARPDAQPEPAQAAPPPKPKRNLLFSSSVRKDRERFPRPGDPAQPPGAPPLPETGETPSASFEDAWQRPDRAKGTEIPPQRRSSRLSATPSESNPVTASAPPPAPTGEQPSTTVLKSGVVDGMAYSLYSDGSIEAQMPEGMMRFASIDELRAYLDQRL
jgi:hypothetical protein